MLIKAAQPLTDPHPSVYELALGRLKLFYPRHPAGQTAELACPEPECPQIGRHYQQMKQGNQISPAYAGRPLGCQ